MATRKPKLANQPVADAYRTCRDATKLNDKLSVSEQLGVLELIKTEIMEDALVDLRRAAMND